MPGAGNPQAWNRYSYVLGNPLRYTDPTGHYCVGDDDDCADEGGTGPAPSSGGNNKPKPKHKGGNPHDDDDADVDLPAGWSTGVYCDASGCHTDGATDISGTLQDPAVYIAGGSAGCWVSGLCYAMAQSAAWYGLNACLSLAPCRNYLAQNGLTVLGRFSTDPNYISVARSLNANVLNLTDRPWSELENLKFINQISTDAQTVFFSSDWTLDESAILFGEAQQLLDKGYQNFANIIMFPPFR